MQEHEQRAHNKLRSYWDSLKGGRAFPPESEIDCDKIVDIWPSCFLISIDDVTRRMGYRYSYLGHDLIDAFDDGSGSPDVALQLLSTAEMPMVKMFDAVCKQAKPMIGEAEFVNAKNLVVKYRTSLLPLGNEVGEVTHILGYMGWKVS